MTNPNCNHLKLHAEVAALNERDPEHDYLLAHTRGGQRWWLRRYKQGDVFGDTLTERMSAKALTEWIRSYRSSDEPTRGEI